MFNQVFDNLRKATDITLQMQRDMFNKWVSLWPPMSNGHPNFAEEAQKYQKKWSETVAEFSRKQQASLEEQFKLGLKNIENTFTLAQAKDLEELRQKTMELWQNSFSCLRQMYETQLRDFQNAMDSWKQMVEKVQS